MKHLRLSALFLTFGMLAKGQTCDFDIKSTQKSLVKINDSLFASKFEVTNKQYLIFLNFLKQSHQVEKYLVSKIDSSNWRNELTFNEPYVQYYHSHPAYADYPVVNISYEGATHFCEWLTAQYNSKVQRKFKKVRFRLPTRDEWITAAKSGNSQANYPWNGNNFKTKKGLVRCNFKREIGVDREVVEYKRANADITAPSKSYWPNKFGLYNMSGNVAEMLAEKGQTKGGSWQDAADAMKIESNGKFAIYDSPMSTIGFRFFMDVLEK